MKLLNQSFWSIGEETPYFLKSFIYYAQWRLSLLSGISNSIKFFFLSYFIKYKCPPRFSLTSEKAKNNNFYEIHIYVPHPRTKVALKRGEDRPIYMSFFPDEVASRYFRLMSGRKKYNDSDDLVPGFLSAEYLSYARLDVYYFRGTWQVREHNCSLFALLRLYLYKRIGLIHISILKDNILKLIKLWKVNKLKRNVVQNVIKGKYEIFQAIMSSDSIMSKGSFSQSELSDILFGTDYLVETSSYFLVRNSLKWILDACVHDGELQVINQDRSTFKITGKGVHYFTETRQKYLQLENINKLTEKQIKVQKSVSFLTYLLVVVGFVTALSQAEQAVDGFDFAKRELMKLWQTYME